MPCCTLIAFLLSQCGMAAGAVRTRLFGWTAPSAGLSRFRWPVLAVALVFEMTIGAAAAPYIFTGSGRAEAVRSIGATWHICKVIVGAG